MLTKILKNFLSGFIISFLFFTQSNCCNLNISKNKNDLNAYYLDNKFNEYKSTLINQNFIFLTKYIMSEDHNDFTKICYYQKDDNLPCDKAFIPLSSASGYIIDVNKKENKLYAITAGHWCQEATYSELYESTQLLFEGMPVIDYFVSYMGLDYKINRYVINFKNDLCLIEFESKYAKYAKKIKISKSDPSIGENVSTISAPMWSYQKEIRQHYTGKSSGCDDYECFFTLPATYGSSGSAVINERGEIVSIISRAAVEFNNYVIGAKPEQIKKFIEENL